MRGLPGAWRGRWSERAVLAKHEHRARGRAGSAAKRWTRHEKAGLPGQVSQGEGAQVRGPHSIFRTNRRGE